MTSLKTKDERRKTKGLAGAAGRLKAGLHTLHGDERGAISVLVLLTIWCLVAILGLVWNTMEESVRRERIQTAADAAAHASETWVARTLNTVDAQNMVISQDASEETIWRAVPPTDQALNAEMQRELALAIRMKQQNNLQALIRRLAQQLATIATEYQLTSDALGNIKGGAGANYADANEGLTYANQYRQAASVRDWVWNTYVQGQAPSAVDFRAPARPGPPGPNGEGLAQIVQSWKPPANEDAILDYITNFINTTEIPIIRAFEVRTAPGTAQPIDQIVAAHEAAVYQNELAQVQNLAATIEQQRSAMADFYQTDITLATLKQSAGTPGPAAVQAPLMPAGMAPPVIGYTDSIRAAYPAEAMAAGLNNPVAIDAINVHVNDAIIWHPNIGAPVPADIQAQYPNLKASYQINASFPGGWGHIWAMPLEHYVHQRVNNDMQTLNTDFMAPLDRSRTQTLATAIRQMMGLPNNGNINITNLPGQLPDDTAEPNIPPLKPGDPVPPPRFDQINVLPKITAPLNSTAAFRAQVALYNQHAGAYTGAVRSLRGLIISYTAYFNAFTNAFASDTWNTNVNTQCVAVLEALGNAKQFMVLSTYGLRAIPDWAKAGMFDNAEMTIEDHLMLMNIQPVAQAIVKDLQASDPRGLGAGILDAQYKNSVTYAGYIAQATQIADTIVRPTAHQIALRLAAEWVSRPWPYEITPPQAPVPPFRGISPDERKREYTVIAAARQTDATAPKLLLTKFFGTDQGKLVAYGQGETFNWMEYNAEYGGGERFDEVVQVPEVTYRSAYGDFHDLMGAPRGWRVDSLGGMNYRARLSLSDTLYDALQVNQELAAYLQDAGIENPPSGALDEINLH